MAKLSYGPGTLYVGGKPVQQVESVEVEVDFGMHDLAELRVRALLGRGPEDTLPLSVAVLLATRPDAAVEEAWRLCDVPARMLDDSGWSVEGIETSGGLVGAETRVQIVRQSDRLRAEITLAGVSFGLDGARKYLECSLPELANDLRYALRVPQRSHGIFGKMKPWDSPQPATAGTASRRRRETPPPRPPRRARRER
jgi:hypothetical protein